MLQCMTHLVHLSKKCRFLNLCLLQKDGSLSKMDAAAVLLRHASRSCNMPIARATYPEKVPARPWDSRGRCQSMAVSTYWLATHGPGGESVSGGGSDRLRNVLALGVVGMVKSTRFSATTGTANRMAASPPSSGELGEHTKCDA